MRVLKEKVTLLESQLQNMSQRLVEKENAIMTAEQDKRALLHKLS